MNNREKLRDLLAQHGLTCRKAANLLGKHPDTVRKWSAGMEPTPDWAIELLGYKATDLRKS